MSPSESISPLASRSPSQSPSAWAKSSSKVDQSPTVSPHATQSKIPFPTEIITAKSAELGNGSSGNKEGGSANIGAIAGGAVGGVAGIGGIVYAVISYITKCFKKELSDEGGIKNNKVKIGGKEQNIIYNGPVYMINGNELFHQSPREEL